VQDRLIQAIQIKFYGKRLGQIQHICPFKCSIHNCICQLPKFQLIFSSSGVNRHGHTHIHVSTAKWQGLDTCQQKTHVVENRLAPDKIVHANRPVIH